MKRITAFLLSLIALAASAQAMEGARPVAQVPLVPLADSVPGDIEAVLHAFWPQFYNSNGENGFGPDNLRVGRIDLNGDDQPELVLMVNAPGWEAAQGFPMVVAQWRKGRWIAIGWGWGDEDTVFATSETLGGWRTIDSGKMIMRWQGREYRAEDKP